MTTYLQNTDEHVPMQVAKPTWANPRRVFCPYCGATQKAVPSDPFCLACGGEYLLKEAK